MNNIFNNYSGFSAFDVPSAWWSFNCFLFLKNKSTWDVVLYSCIVSVEGNDAQGVIVN